MVYGLPQEEGYSMGGPDCHPDFDIRHGLVSRGLKLYQNYAIIFEIWVDAPYDSESWSCPPD